MTQARNFKRESFDAGRTAFKLGKSDKPVDVPKSLLQYWRNGYYSARRDAKDKLRGTT